MGRFSKLERETQDALARQKVVKEKAAEKPAPPTEDIYDAPYYIDKADEAFFTGEYKQALKFYSRAIQIDNTLHYPWLGQIYCLIAMEQLKEADLWTGRALEMFPEDSAILSLRAMTYANRGMYKRALNTCDYAITRKGARTHTYIARGYVLLVAGNKNSHFCFMKAMEMAGNRDWKIPMRIGYIYFRNKKYSRALDFFLKACARNISNYYLWHHIGLCYQKLGFGHKALEAFRHALDHNPDYTPAEDALHKASRSSVFSRLFRRVTGVVR